MKSHSNLRANLPPLPDRLKLRPVDKRGYPVPWFVAYIDGEPDFRVIRKNGIAEAYNKKLCWVCGRVRGAIGAFVVGPMCAVNRTSAEPPSHLDCAVFSALGCPFLTLPKAQRRESGLEETGALNPAGIFLKRNPGCSLVWTSRNWKPFRAGDGVLFNIGDPIATRWYAEGREATRAEVLASFISSLPFLEDEAKKDGPIAIQELAKMYNDALQLIPA